jgi:hypothetical protein
MGGKKYNMRKVIICLLAIVLITISCGDELEHKPIYGSGSTPTKVENIKVERTNGGAVIEYSLPQNNDLEYVQAKIYKADDMIQQYMSSIYKNKIEIEGLPDTTEYRVELSVFDCHQNESPKEDLTIRPLIPNYLAIYNNISLKADFGGATFEWLNENMIDLSMFTYVKDTLGQFNIYEIKKVYPENTSFSIDGLDTVNSVCGIRFRDQWGNFTQMYVDSVVPIYEKKMDGSKWELVQMESDNYTYINSISRLGDDNVTSERFELDFEREGGTGVFTWDAKELIMVSKLKAYNKTNSSGWIFRGQNVKSYEIYGSNVLSDDWSDWTDITPDAVPNLIPSSGYEGGSPSSADLEEAKKGYVTKADPSLGYFRYFRFKLIKNFANEAQFAIAGLFFYGQSKEIE